MIEYRCDKCGKRIEDDDKMCWVRVDYMKDMNTGKIINGIICEECIKWLAENMKTARIDKEFVE